MTPMLLGFVSCRDQSEADKIGAELLRKRLIACMQIVDRAPMVRAFKAGKSVAEPVIPETRIAILSTGDPVGDVRLIFY